MNRRNVEVFINPIGQAAITCHDMTESEMHQVHSLVRLAMRARAGSIEERIRSYVAVAMGIIPAVVTTGHYLPGFR